MFKYNEITELAEGPFKYVLVTGSIDSWIFTLEKKQLLNNLRDYYYDNTDYYEAESIDIDKIESFIINSITNFEQKPHTIRYTSIPSPNSSDCSLVAIAKIYNNGTCFIFSNNKEYLKLI